MKNKDKKPKPTATVITTNVDKPYRENKREYRCESCHEIFPLRYLLVSHQENCDKPPLLLPEEPTQQQQQIEKEQLGKSGQAPILTPHKSYTYVFYT